MSLIVNGSTGSIIGTLPAGMVMYFANTTVPQGWFQCVGTAVSRTNYPELFAAIGTTYGAGDGSTTFNLPDFRGQFLRSWASSSTTVTVFSGFISDNIGINPGPGNILKVDTAPSSRLYPGLVLTGSYGSTSLAAGTIILNQLTGTTGGAGTYTVSGPAIITAGGFTITAKVPDAGRTMGFAAVETDAIRNITGSFQGATNGTRFSNVSGAFNGNGSANADVGSFSTTGNTTIVLNASTQVPTSTENRPVNSALMVCIKY